MADLGTATAAPISIKIKGEKYSLSPLTWEDYGEYERWMQSVALEQLSHESIQQLPADQRREVQAHITDRAAHVCWDVSEFDKSEGAELSRRIATSTRGVAQMLWLGMRKHHEDMKVECIERAIVEDTELADELIAALDRVNAIPDPEGASKKKTKKAASKKKRVRKSR